MKVDGVPYRGVWVEADGWTVGIIDQTKLPFDFVTLRLADMAAAAHAIRSMQVRGAPLIGAVAAYGMGLAMRADSSDAGLKAAYDLLVETRPTAINLRWALDDMFAVLKNSPAERRVEAAYRRAKEIADEDVAINRAIGEHAAGLIGDAWEKKNQNPKAAQPDRLNILTHCNAGWLATVDWGTALAGIYVAHDEGLPVHVWVDETRPRNQGASLTAWELGRHGVPFTLIPDNAGGHLMQHGLVDLCIVGTDRVTANGDVANKIGTYLKAVAAKDNDVPFYVALPSPTIDWTMASGKDIPIEQRDPREVTHITGRDEKGALHTVEITPPDTPAANYGFDVTPARLVTALVTERGVAPATSEGLKSLFPERKKS